MMVKQECLGDLKLKASFCSSQPIPQFDVFRLRIQGKGKVIHFYPDNK
jgi:hypothetical protein